MACGGCEGKGDSAEPPVLYPSRPPVRSQRQGDAGTLPIPIPGPRPLSGDAGVQPSPVPGVRSLPVSHAALRLLHKPEAWRRECHQKGRGVSTWYRPPTPRTGPREGWQCQPVPPLPAPGNEEAGPATFSRHLAP